MAERCFAYSAFLGGRVLGLVGAAGILDFAGVGLTADER
jgi:hypothetical protein